VGKSDLFPGVDFHITDATRPLSDDVWSKVRLNETPCYVWGKIYYRDAFDPEKRFTTKPRWPSRP
jgi:hypothetical protein